MKRKRIIFVIVTLALAMVLSSCAMGPRAVGTPGLTAGEDKVFVAFQQYVYGVNTASGSEVWRYPSKGNIQVVFYAPPEVDGDALYVGDLSNKFHKLNSSNGAEVWTFDQAKGWFIGKAKAAEDIILAPSSDRSLYALDETGLLLWKFEKDFALWGQPIVEGETVYFGSLDHKVYALALKTGELLWEVQLGGAINASPLFDPETGLLYVGSLGREMVAINAESGKIAWRYPEDSTISSVWAAPILQEGQLIFTDETGKIISLEPKTGGFNWTIEAGGKTMGGLLAIEGGFVTVMEDGTVRAFDYERNPLWTRNISGELYTTPVLSNDVIVIAAFKSDSLLYAFDQNGNQIWSYQPAK